MTTTRWLVPAILLGRLLAPVALTAQSAELERRPYLILNGGFSVQGSGETSTSSALGGPQLSVGVGVRVARDVALRAEYGGQWFLRGAEPVYVPCSPLSAPCSAAVGTRDLRGTHLLAELRHRVSPRGLAYLVAGPSLVWARNDQASPDAVFSPQARRAAGATVGVGLGVRSAPRTDRGVRIEARYTALTHAVAATHSLVGLGLGLWI